MQQKIKIRLVREPHYVVKDLDKAGEVALFYGFQPVKTPKIEKSDIDEANSLVSNRGDIQKTAFPRPEEKLSVLRTALSWNILNDNQPVMLHYKRPITQLSIKRSPDELNYSLDIIGAQESIAEAIAIRTAIAILADHGYSKLMVDINSIGDKYSIGQFERELGNFTRKHGTNMPPEVKQQLRKDPFECLKCDHEKWREVRDRVPQSLSFLSEQSIEHFREVLEYMETLDIPYRINPSLVGHRHYCSHTIFEIKSSPEQIITPAGSEPIGTPSTASASPAVSATTPATAPTEEVYAVGTRHNYLAKRVGFKKDTPIVGVNLSFKKQKVSPKLFFKSKPQAKFFFIQFGSIAKLKSLSVIESLRQARIPVQHLLNSNKFEGQLNRAESLKMPFVIIMGQKEALENSVVVRHLPSRSQEIVPLPHLALYLSKIK